MASRDFQPAFRGGIAVLLDQSGAGSAFVRASRADEDPVVRRVIGVKKEGIGVSCKEHLALVLGAFEDGGIDVRRLPAPHLAVGFQE